MVRAPNSKSGDLKIKSRSNHQQGWLTVVSGSTPRLCELVCLVLVWILILSSLVELFGWFEHSRGNCQSPLLTMV